MISRGFNVARQSSLSLRALQKFKKRFPVSSNYIMDEGSASNTRRNLSSLTNHHVNKLVSERSPYLLQHANNPVDWYPWNDEALAKARAENKLIFLSVGYSTCHWCHVMERESFENESIASIMNEHFVNIKVDREERPDIDRVYMTFVQLASGSGGWPMSVFLTPDLHPVAGGTYFAPEDRWGRPGFKSVLLQMSNRWREKPDELRQIGAEVINSLKKVSAFEVGLVNELTGGAVPEIECADMCMQQLSKRFDAEFGGFSYAPKFPQPCNLMFLFHYYSRNPTGEQNKLAYNMALLTLEKMSKGGIHDHIGQGFARYSTDERWHVPHFEKMLYDQAQLVVAYATGYLLSGRNIFRDMVEDILSYVERNLTHAEGGLYSAEDADSLPTHESSDKSEGAFYVWTFSEIESLLSQPLSCKSDVLLSDVFCHHYNIRSNGNVDPSNDPHGELLDKNVLIVLGSERETAENFGISEKELSDELKTAHQILFEERNKRPRPHLDDKIVLSWNGLMLSAYARAAQILQNDSYKAKAIKIAEFIRKYLWLKDSNRLLHCCYVDEKSREVTQTKNMIHGFLNDYTFLIRGLLDLYECTYDSNWIEWCENLQDIQNQLFWDSSAKAFNLGCPEYHFSTILVKDDEDGAEPSGNSVTVQNLLRLSSLVDRNDYNEKAEQILSVFTSRLSRFPSSLPEMTCGLMFHHDSPTQIYVVGGKDNKAEEMLTVIQQFYIPNRVLVLINEANPLFYHKSEIVKKMVDSAQDGTAVHICRNRVCSLPVTTVESLKSSLKLN